MGWLRAGIRNYQAKDDVKWANTAQNGMEEKKLMFIIYYVFLFNQTFLLCILLARKLQKFKKILAPEHLFSILSK
jgi:hypothetical protein